MFYLILFTVFAAGWWIIGREERARKREKERQAALWRLAGIREIIAAR